MSHRCSRRDFLLALTTGVIIPEIPFIPPSHLVVNGVTIHWDWYQLHFLHPTETTDDKIEITAVSQEGYELTKPIIIQFINWFADIGFNLKSVLNDIFVCGDLIYRNVQAKGLYIGRSIYIKAEAFRKKTANEELTGVLHHELSSILAREYHFPYEDFKAINPIDFKYIGLEQTLKKKERILTPYANLLSQGILVPYGLTSAENDFNEIVNFLFTRPCELQEYAQQYSRIADKVALVKWFYNSIRIPTPLDNDFSCP